MFRLTTTLLSVLAFGCFDPRFEVRPDAGMVVLDSGIQSDAGPVDAGFPRKDCSAGPDAGLFMGVGLLPEGCTHFKGNLIGLNNDYSTTRVTSLVEIDGRLKLENGGMTDSLRGFEALREVTGALDLSVLPIASTSGMRNLRSAGLLFVFRNFRLEELDFPALESVQTDLRIIDNAQLRSLAGLKNLRYIGGQFIHGRNPNLSQTALNEFLQRVVIDGGVVEM